MKIVYESNAGHTEEYAKKLAEKLDIEAVNIKDYKSDEEPIIFMGWIFGSHVSGYNTVKEEYCKIICVIGVGMCFASEKNTNMLMDTNNITEKFFYLQGGVDYKKLKGLKKFMLKMVGKSVIKENKPEDKDIIEVFKNGSENNDYEELDKIYDYIKVIE